MTTTIAIANRKGGVGKTTTAVTVATWLARHGRRVILVDLDAQGHVATYLGLPPADSVFRVLVAKADPTNELVAWDSDGKLSILRGDRSTADAKTLIAVKGLPPSKAMKTLFGPLQSLKPDFILCDTQPAEDPVSMAILFHADFALAPVECEFLALDGLRQLATNIAELRDDLHATTRLLGIVPQMFEGRSREHNQNLKLLVDTYGRLVYPVIGKRSILRESVTAGQPIWDYAPTSKAADEYQTMIERLLKDVEGRGRHDQKGK